MINSITVEGRIVKDIELKGNENKFLSNTIAVYGGKDKDGYEITYFFDFKAFNYNANKLNAHATKGSYILIKGDLRQDKWEKDGNTYTKSVIYASDIMIADVKKVDQVQEEEKPNEADLPW